MSVTVEQTAAGTMISYPEHGAQSRVIRVVSNQPAVLEVSRDAAGTETYSTTLLVEDVGEESAS